MGRPLKLGDFAGEDEFVAVDFGFERLEGKQRRGPVQLRGEVADQFVSEDGNRADPESGLRGISGDGDGAADF